MPCPHVCVVRAKPWKRSLGRAGKMDFKVEGPWNTGKYCRPPRLADNKNFWILNALEWLKQPFNSFCFEILSFFPSFPYFLFAMQKNGGGGPWPPTPPLPPGVTGLVRVSYKFYCVKCKGFLWISVKRIILFSILVDYLGNTLPPYLLLSPNLLNNVGNLKYLFVWSEDAIYRTGCSSVFLII